MEKKSRLKKAIHYAIESNYKIHERALEVKNALYSHKNVCIWGTGDFLKVVQPRNIYSDLNM